MKVRALIAAAAMVATTAGMATPAHAGKNVSVKITGHQNILVAYGAFHSNGDRLQLLDYCYDEALYYLQVRNGAEQKTYYATGAPHRCGTRWINRTFRPGRDIGIRLCRVVKQWPDKCTSWRWGIA